MRQHAAHAGRRAISVGHCAHRQGSSTELTGTCVSVAACRCFHSPSLTAGVKTACASRILQDQWWLELMPTAFLKCGCDSYAHRPRYGEKLAVATS